MQRFFDYQLVEHLEDIDLSGTVSQPAVINCLNPHSFVVANNDSLFQEALQDSDYLLPDGEGICLSMKRWKGIKIAKIAGDDLHRYLLEQMERKGGKIFYMGSTALVLDAIVARVHREYPHVAVQTFSPSFCEELPKEESEAIVGRINDFNPDVLFVSMTAPKQEKWVYRHRQKLTGVKVVASIGAVFDFYAGTVKRAPRWAVRMKIEWLFRLVKEPRRMWERNFISTPQYLRWVRKHRKEI